MLILAVQNRDVLRAIAAAHESQTVSGLAEGLGRDKSNLAKTLAALRREGLVQAERLGLTGAAHDLLPGLDALEGRTFVPEGMANLTHAQLQPSPLNPRKDFDSEAAQAAQDALRQSILTHGLQQNLVVQAEPDANGVRDIIAGESRWRAIGAAVEDGDLPESFAIPCRLQRLTPAEHEELALIENLVRRDLHPLEEAQAYARLRDGGRATSALADATGRTQRHIQERIKLLELGDDDRARMLLPKDDPDHLTLTGARHLVQGRPDAADVPEDVAGMTIVQLYAAAAPWATAELERRGMQGRATQPAAHAAPVPPPSDQIDIEDNAPRVPAAAPAGVDRRPGHKAVAAMVEIAVKALRENGDANGWVCCGETYPDTTGLSQMLVSTGGGFASGGGRPAVVHVGRTNLAWLREQDLLPTLETADALLDRVRLPAYPAKAVQEAAQTGRWLTPWLNEDHVADPGRAQRDADHADERAQRTADHAARTAEYEAATERAAQLAHDVHAFARGADALSLISRQRVMRDLLARSGAPTPWRASVDDDLEQGPFTPDDAAVDLYAMEPLVVLAFAMATGAEPSTWGALLGPEPQLAEEMQ